MNNAIELENVSKIYKKGFKALKIHAVNDLTFSVQKGKVTGFVGPNGAGKTTTIKMILGLVFPTSGKILLNGISSSDSKCRNKVAYLTEQPYFYKHLTIFESLQFIADLIGLPRSQSKVEIENALSVVELISKSSLKVRELSKGMQQRLNFAQAILGNPEILIFDEPMSGMDPPGRRLFRKLFKDLVSQGKTLFFSTHVLEDIEAVCDEVIVLSNGKLTYSGAVKSLLEKGYSGTDFTTAILDNSIVEQLKKLGFEILQNENEGITNIFVPSGNSVDQCHKILCSNNIYPKSITQRTLPLETLLYGTKKGELLK